jgi:hypothetical protein
MLSTHSPDLLSDGSISAREIILLDAAKEGTRVRTANDIDDVRTLLESGLSPEEVVIPFSSPKEAEQLGLFK